MALQTIVALVSGSPLDSDLVRQAELLAGRTGRVVLVKAVHGGPCSDEAAESRAAADAMDYLARLASRPGLAGQVDTRALYGNPAGAVLEEAFLCKTDMVVMGLPGMHGFGDCMAGSVAEHVLARSPVPAFLVRTDSDWRLHALQPGQHHGILVALDGSTFAEAALSVAAELASRTGVRSRCCK